MIPFPVANESQWRTEDLLNLVEKILETPGFRRSSCGDGTLLLFKTDKSQIKDESIWGKRKAAEYKQWGAAADRYSNTRLVLIRSADKLKTDVLDRIANSDVQQDMSQDDLMCLVKAVSRAIGGYNGAEYCNFSWIKDAPMRIGPPKKKDRSKDPIERRIAALERNRRDILRAADRAAQKVSDKIAELRKKL